MPTETDFDGAPNPINRVLSPSPVASARANPVNFMFVIGACLFSSIQRTLERKIDVCIRYPIPPPYLHFGDAI